MGSNSGSYLMSEVFQQRGTIKELDTMVSQSSMQRLSQVLPSKLFAGITLSQNTQQSSESESSHQAHHYSISAPTISGSDSSKYQRKSKS